MTPAEYWKFVALLQRIDVAAERLQAAKLALFQEHGLDPARTYRFDDAMQTMTVASPETPNGG